MKLATLHIRPRRRAELYGIFAVQSLILTVMLACSSATRHFDLGYSRVTMGDLSADVFVADTRADHIQIIGRNASSHRSGSFIDLDRSMSMVGTKLLFATNGGMFHANYDPVGLLIQDGVEKNPINLNQGEGNFFLMPNGVFVVTADEKVAVIRSDRPLRSLAKVRSATQSGPLLVIDGKINPAFKANSQNRFVRSGVGVINSHTVVFVLSGRPISFWDFAQIFKRSFRCKDALYLDGAISKFYIPGHGQTPQDDQYGVLIGVTQ